MATTSDDTTMTFTTADGTESGPFTMRDLDDARDRLRDGTPSQLSFDVGMGHRAKPDCATLKIAGTFGVDRDLRYSEHVTITVSDARGEVIATQPATVGWPAFRDKTSGELTFTERAHTATLD